MGVFFALVNQKDLINSLFTVKFKTSGHFIN